MDESKRFYPNEILSEGERYYRYFVDKLEFVQKGKSYTDKYKMIIWMYDDNEKTVYGGAHDNVGMTWFSSVQNKRVSLLYTCSRVRAFFSVYG